MQSESGSDLRAQFMKLVAAQKTETPLCSFCGAGAADVAMLIAGPTVFICDQCLSLCMIPFAANHRELFERAVSEAVAASA